jgi:protease I
MAKVLILAGDAAEDLEVMFVRYRLVEAGHEPNVAAPTTRPIKLVVHDFEDGWDAYVERPGRQCPVDVAFVDVEPSAYAALVIPGGRAPEYIRVDPNVRRIVEHFFATGKPVGTLCHGPQVPAEMGLLAGRRCAGYPPMAPDIEAAGGTFVDGPDVVDRNLVSARGWGDLGEWSRAFMGVLETALVEADRLVTHTRS